MRKVISNETFWFFVVVLAIVAIIGLCLAANWIFEPYSPIATPTVTPTFPPVATPTAPAPDSPVATPVVSVKAVTAPHFSDNKLEVYCSAPGFDGSPVGLWQAPDEITATLRLTVKMQLRQNNLILIEQQIPSYLTMQAISPTVAPTQTCSGLFKAIDYSWADFSNSPISGNVDEYVWLQYVPDPLTATLYYSGTGELYNYQTAEWYIMDGQIVPVTGYAYYRTFAWQTAPTNFVFLPVIVK